MPKLIAEQAKTLAEIIKFARRNGWKVPTAKELAYILGIGERAASARIKRLIDNHPECFISERREKLINFGKLVTEKETADLFLKIYEMAASDQNGRVSKKGIIKILNWLTPDEAHNYIKKACNSGYLQVIIANPHDVRPSPKLFDHLEYLRILRET